MNRREVVLGGTMLAGGLALPAAQSFGQAYPERPVRVVVPFPAGGPTDVTARVIAQGLSERLGKQFYVENIPGAGGNTGTVQVARAKPDGHTLLVASTGFMVNPSLYVNVPYDARKEFAPITIACASPNILSIHPEVPAKNLKELIDVIKANPGKYSYGFPGAGSTPHLSGELLRLQFGLDITPVPFTGAAPAITSTLGGHTPLVWTALPPALEAVKAGKLRGIVVTGEKRASGLPEVPTIAEAGVSGQEAETLTAVLAPAGTPPDIVDRLYREIAALVGDAAVKEKLVALGFEPIANTPQQFAQRIEVELGKWARVISEAKIPRIQ